MREIGGYFGMEKLIHREYYETLIAVNNARNALLYILRAKGYQKIWLPRFLCDSVVNMCRREHIAVGWYEIETDFLPVFQQSLEDRECLYVVNYYGQLKEENVLSLQDKYEGRLILDNVQAFFQPPLPGVDTVYSCRKFFGVPDGAYAATNARLDVPLRRDISMGRMRHVLGRFEGECASDYYAEFRKSENEFPPCELMEMSSLTRNLLGAIDYNAVKEKRESNFRFLHDRLAGRNRLELRLPPGPYAYPFYCEGGMELKGKLAKRGIYVATLWPNVRETCDGLEKDYAENILPLPCDQRYDTEDMEYMLRIMDECLIAQ